jgi:hypothetical protein
VAGIVRTVRFLLLAALLLPPLAHAAEDEDRAIARDDEITELKRKLDVVVTELETLRTQVAAPEVPAALESQYGLGPAASKIYGIARGVSIGGYAEGFYRRANEGADDEWDMTRVVAYLGYKFNDWIVFNTEIEFEHGSTENEGSVSVEFATLDFLLRPELNVRIGEVLLPMGFVNEFHEPPFYYSTSRPTPERVIIPSTWRENGVGIFGNLGERLAYRVYVVNGFDASGFSAAGLRGGRQNGSEALANDLAVVGRLDLDVIEGMRVGGSYYVGNAGQDQDIDVAGTPFDVPDSRTSVWEVHGEYRWQGLTTRALWTQARVADAGSLSGLLSLAGEDDPVVSRRLIGGYGELAYDLIPLFFPGSEMSLEPFFRFEYVDTQNDVPSGFTADRSFKQRLYIPGIQFKPIPNVVLKVDYRKIDDFANGDDDEVSFGFGLIF